MPELKAERKNVWGQNKTGEPTGRGYISESEMKMLGGLLSMLGSKGKDLFPRVVSVGGNIPQETGAINLYSDRFSGAQNPADSSIALSKALGEWILRMYRSRSLSEPSLFDANGRANPANSSWDDRTGDQIGQLLNGMFNGAPISGKTDFSYPLSLIQRMQRR
jgi:hypothetical protein